MAFQIHDCLETVTHDLEECRGLLDVKWIRLCFLLLRTGASVSYLRFATGRSALLGGLGRPEVDALPTRHFHHVGQVSDSFFPRLPISMMHINLKVPYKVSVPFWGEQTYMELRFIRRNISLSYLGINNIPNYHIRCSIWHQIVTSVGQMYHQTFIPVGHQNTKISHLLPPFADPSHGLPNAAGCHRLAYVQEPDWSSGQPRRLVRPARHQEGNEGCWSGASVFPHHKPSGKYCSLLSAHIRILCPGM